MSFKESAFGLIPESWEVKTFDDITTLVTDYVSNGSFASLKENVTYNSIPDYAVLIRSKDFNSGFKNDFVYVDKRSYDFLSKSRLFGGEIIISNVGNAGTVFKCPYLGKPMTLGPNSILVKTKFIDNFYYYWLTSRYGQHQLNSIIAGSAQPKFNKTEFKKLEVPIPPIGVQEGITKILSSLDDKIDINREINRNLELLAHTLYKSWFVDFEFPNNEGKPYKKSGGEMIETEFGSIPKLWTAVSLNDKIFVYNGYSYRGTELTISDTGLITLKNFDRNGGFTKHGFKDVLPLKSIKSKLYVEPFDCLVACTDLTQNAEIIGNPILILSKYNYKKLIPSMDLVKLNFTDENIKMFIYETLKYKKFKDHAVGCSSGTTVLHLNKKAAFNYKIIMPNDIEIVHTFNQMIYELYAKIMNNHDESTKLELIKDELLPRLMNGEIEVPIEG